MTVFTNKLIARLILKPLIWLGREVTQTTHGFLNLALTEERSSPLHWFYFGCGSAIAYTLHAFDPLWEQVQKFAAWNDRQIVRAKEASNDS